MGNCTLRDDNVQEVWCYLNKNFDRMSFRVRIDFDQYLAYQKFLEHLWENFIFYRDKDQKAALRYEMKHWVVKGAPNRIVKELIELVVPINNKECLEIYESMQKKIDESGIFETEVEAFQGNPFFLSEEGKMAFRRLEFLAKYVLEIEYLEGFDKILQLILWFFPEHEAYTLAEALIRTDITAAKDFHGYFFRSSEEKHDIITKLTDKLCETGADKKLCMKILHEMVENLFSGYLLPLYYPYILINFFVDGIEAIFRIAYSLFSLINYEEMTSSGQIRSEIQNKFSYVNFISIYANANLESIFSKL